LKPLLELLRVGYVLLGAFLVGCALVILGLALYLWLVKPQRLAARFFPETQLTVIIDPQPAQVPLDETNVTIIEPPATAYVTGAATNAAIWVHGKAFKSGREAAWFLVKSAWPLWLLSAVTLICGLFLRRYGSARKTKSD